MDFPMEIEVYKSKGRKVQQVIWLKPLTFSKILMLADKYNVAPNVVISEILDKVLNDQSILFKKEIVEKEVIKVACPICLNLFPDLETLKNHIKRDHKEVYEKILDTI